MLKLSGKIYIMRNLQILFLAVIAMIITTSCNIEHTVNFNEDLSGNNSIEVDANEMINTLRSYLPESVEKTNEELLGNRSFENDIDSVKKQFDKVEGVSNLNVKNHIDKGVIALNFDFDNQKYFVDGIAAMALDASSEEIKKGEFFILGKDSLTLDFTSEAVDAAMGNNEGIEDLNAYNLGNYNFTLNFPFPIKTFNNELYVLSDNQKSLSLKVPIRQLVTEREAFNVVLTW